MIAVAETHQGSLIEGSVFDERLSKKPKTSEAPSQQQQQPTTASSSTNIIPSSVIVAFLNIDGIRTGPPIDLPVQSTSKQIEILVNSLLENKDYLPYAFYVHNKEVISSLSDTLMDIKGEDSKQNFEDTISITFQPLSVYRVRPVTRCIETMPGMHLTYLYYTVSAIRHLVCYLLFPDAVILLTLGHSDAVLHVSYSPDGKRLASGGGDMAVRFWHVSSSTPAHTSLGHKHHVLCTGWVPNGLLFVSADKSGECCLID